MKTIPPVLQKLLFIFLLIISSVSVRAQEKELIYNDTDFIYRSIPEALQSPLKVFRLNLHAQKLDTFPHEIFQFKNLVELDLSKNLIEEIPAEIGTLSHLEKLIMSNNKLVHLPKEIGDLIELKYLGLNRNEIEDLPPEIGQLQNLEEIELWDNELGTVPDEIGDLQNLKKLELRGILFTQEEQHRIDSLVVKSAKIYLSPSCNCKN